jgi:pyruvate dehydrogenase E1 component alpha subunit
VNKPITKGNHPYSFCRHKDGTITKTYPDGINAQQLIAFERSIADAFERGEIHGPVHLSGGNESQLIEIFKDISPEDYVFSTWRNHYHALLHGIPEDWLRQEIMAGHSMNIMNHEHKFFTSAIVGGICPIAVGVAAGIKRRGGSEKVWCFVGDMCATTGIFSEAYRYSLGQHLPITFIIEDNGLSTNTPTDKVWGAVGDIEQTKSILNNIQNIIYYTYTRTYPHYGVATNAAI